MAQNYTLLARFSPRNGRRDALDRYGGVPLPVALLLELEHLAIELVCKRVDRRVHVGLDAFGMDVLAAYVQIVRHVGADRRRDVEVMAAQVQIHPGLLCVARSAARAPRITPPCAR